MERLANPLIPVAKEKLSKEEKKRRKALSSKKVLNSINSDIFEKAAKTHPEFSEQLNQYINQSREFLLTDIAPKRLGIEAGLTQGLEVLGEITGGTPSKKIIKEANAMLDIATKLKLSEMIAHSFNLTEEQQQVVYDATVRKMPKHSILMMPNLSDVKSEKP